MNWLTHWGWVTQIFANELTIVGSDNGFSPGRHQAIIWTNTGILLIEPLLTNFSEILTEFCMFSFKKMCRKWRLFCTGLNVLKQRKPCYDVIAVVIAVPAYASSPHGTKQSARTVLITQWNMSPLYDKMSVAVLEPANVTIFQMKYAQDFVVLCLVWLYCQCLLDPYDPFTHILQGFSDTGEVAWLPQFKRSNSDGTSWLFCVQFTAL